VVLVLVNTKSGGDAAGEFVDGLGVEGVAEAAHAAGFTVGQGVGPGGVLFRCLFEGGFAERVGFAGRGEAAEVVEVSGQGARQSEGELEQHPIERNRSVG
jgi:propanediol dehydratase large subunit